MGVTRVLHEINVVKNKNAYDKLTIAYQIKKSVKNGSYTRVLPELTW